MIYLLLSRMPSLILAKQYGIRHLGLVTFPFNLAVQFILTHQSRGKLVFHRRERQQQSPVRSSLIFFFFFLKSLLVSRILCLSFRRTSICCRQSATHIHGFSEVTSPPAPLPPLGGCSQGHASLKRTDFSGRYAATNQSHYR